MSMLPIANKSLQLLWKSLLAEAAMMDLLPKCFGVTARAPGLAILVALE